MELTKNISNARRSSRLAIVVILTLVASMAMSSCVQDDDDVLYNTIQGDWIETAPYSGWFSFYGNGTGVYSYDDYQYGMQDYGFSWWVNDGVLSIDLYDYPGYYPDGDYSYSFQGNALYLYPYDGGNPTVLQPY